MRLHLFLLTLGPVQSFIAQARKTQDLYAGSEILSRLVRTGIEAFEKEFPDNGKITFPTFDRNKEQASLPNRFVAVIKHDFTREELDRKARNIQNAIEAEWVELANRTVSTHLGKQVPAGFGEQINAHLDIFWSFRERANDTGEDYAEAYTKLEALVGSIKNVRSFEQYQYADTDTGLGESGRKCSIDGVNNALLYRDIERENQRKRKPAFLANYARPIDSLALNSGEGLSAISFVKRFYPNAEKFPSTAEVALMQDEKNLLPQEKEWFNCYKLLFQKERIVEACIKLFNGGLIEQAKIDPTNREKWNDQPDDYQMLYEENLTSDNFPDDDQLQLVRRVHAKLKSHFKTKYYAIVLFDGDKMGKWLAGDNNLTKVNLEDFHTELSALLASFGKEAFESLNREHGNGQAVYAGGDDFLGFVNIHHLFDMMKNLRIRFDQTVNQGIAEFKQPEKDLTFSAGIVIAHYKMPFSEVLKKVRAVEKKAKKEGGRNAFAISVLKHSGEVQEAVYKWDGNEDSAAGCATWDALRHIVSELDQEKGHFSGKFIQNLSSEFYGLTGVDLHDLDMKPKEREFLENALSFEIKRSVHRALDTPETPGKDEERKKALAEAVDLLWKQAPHPKTRNFIHALHIADFITRKTTR